MAINRLLILGQASKRFKMQFSRSRDMRVNILNRYNNKNLIVETTIQGPIHSCISKKKYDKIAQFVVFNNVQHKNFKKSDY